MGSSNVWMIGVLSVIVILSACFNYTNLSIARSLRRSREIGIRKVVGALRCHVLGQFVVEAVMISFFALVFSFALFVLIKPYFLSLNDGYREMLFLDISAKVILYFILLAVGVGVAAGFFPAIFFCACQCYSGVEKYFSHSRIQECHHAQSSYRGSIYNLADVHCSNYYRL